MRKRSSEKHTSIVGGREPVIHHEWASFQDDVPRRECTRENKNGILGRTPGHSGVGIADACRIAIGASRRLISRHLGDLRAPEPSPRLTLSFSQIGNSELAKFAVPGPTPRRDSPALGRQTGFPAGARRRVPSSTKIESRTLRSLPSFFHQHTSDGLPDLGSAETSGPEEYGPMDEPFMEDPLP